MVRLTHYGLGVAAAAIVTMAFGCGGPGNPANPTPTEPATTGGSGTPGGSGGTGGSGGSGSANAQGRLTLRITDSPFGDAKAVLVTFDNVSVHRSTESDEAEGEDEGVWEDIPFAGGATERTCDLKKLEGPTDLLGSEMLPAGHYTQIRLRVKQASIHFDNESTSATACEPSITVPGTQFTSVKVPSGVVKLNRPFTLDPGAALQILLDFDGDKSIRRQGKKDSAAPEKSRYSLQPVISIVSVTPQ